MKKKIIIKFLGLQFSRRDPIFQKLMGPRTPFWKCLAPTLVLCKKKIKVKIHISLLGDMNFQTWLLFAN